MVDNCLAAVDAANKGRLNDDQLAEIVAEMQARRDRAATNLDALDRHLFNEAEQLAADAMRAAKLHKRSTMINVIREAELLQLAARADGATDDPSLGLEAAMVGINTPFEGSRASVDAKAMGIIRMDLGNLLSELRQAGVAAKFRSKMYEREIAQELWDLSLPEPTGRATDSKDAKTIAAIVHKYRRRAIERENRAGAAIRYRSGYVTRQTHDIGRMRRQGFEAWRDEIGPRMDWDTMEIPRDERAKFLRSAYRAMVTGVRLNIGETDETGMVFAFKGPGNLAKKESASRVLLFRSADDWYEYNQKFGRADLNEGILADIQNSARATALMDTFGTNPRAMFDRVRDKLQAQHGDETGKVDRLKHGRLDRQFAEIDGTVNISALPSAAAWGRGIRAWQSMSKLGGALLSALGTDQFLVAAERRAQGRGIALALADSVRAPIKGIMALTGEERRAAAEMLGAGIDGAMGDAVSRFSAQDDAPGRMSKLLGLFFKYNGLGPWSDAQKRGVGLMMANDLARYSGQGWDGLPATTREMLSTYGITADRWELVRGATFADEDGRRYLVPDLVPEGADRAGRRARDDAVAALAAYYSDRTNRAIAEPNARTRAIQRRGLQPGTAQGEAIRFFMQFKTFPISVILNTLGGITYGRGAKSLYAAFIRGEADMQALALFIAGSTTAGFLSMQLKEIAKGREPREITEKNIGEIITASALQGGALGIYGDFLFGEANRFGSSPIETLAGPFAGAGSDAITILQQLRATTFRGEQPDVAADTIRFVQSNTPFLNVFYAKAAMDYLIIYQLQEMANPGYLRRMEKRMRRQNDQEFFLPPSRAIPRGGGDRVFEGVR
ncbi:MAG: hypothetical protein AAFR47_02290 [Pseudomonadota bacterium]